MLRFCCLIAAIGLAGCGTEAEPPAAASVETSAATPASSQPTGSASGPSWGVAKGEAAESSTEAETAAEAAPEVSAPPVRPPEPQEIVDRDDHVDFALDFLGRQSFNSVDGLMGLYANRVRYFDRGTISQADVGDDKAAYFQRWPNRYYELSGPVRATTGSRPTIRFDYDFAVSDFTESDERSGRAWVELGLTPSTNGYVIASERGGTY
ncbi:MAG: hypothetical protein AAF791_07555 [Bacteroidota bacterium]